MNEFILYYKCVNTYCARKNEMESENYGLQGFGSHR